MTPTAAWITDVSDLADTERLGAALGVELESGIVLDLRGTLGAGKTTFVRALARGLGIDSGVASPTFVICREHEGRLRLFHLDAYRVEDPGELLLHGWDEMPERGVVAVEWGERIAELLPEERLIIRFEHAGECRRRLRFEARGAVAERLLGRLVAGVEDPEPRDPGDV